VEISYPDDYLDGPDRREYVAAIARKFAVKTFVETGAGGDGGATNVLRHCVDRVILIELRPEYAQYAATKFANDDRVMVIGGDSGPLVERMVEQFDGPMLFWLDAHVDDYDLPLRGEDGDTPIQRELRAIMTKRPQDSVVLVDDARFFGAKPAFPTVEWIRALVERATVPFEVFVKHDIIHIWPTE
jgi:hypothetical protein